MTKPNTIKIDEVEYVRADSKPKGNRKVIVVDRGWIFAGDAEYVELGGEKHIRLSRALHVFKWDSIGFAKVIETAKADLRPISDVEIPYDAKIFQIPVPDDWGIK